jgi:hypothetical protein
MANHRIPGGAPPVEELTAADADGAPVVCRVYRHVRAGHTLPEFYILQFRRLPDGRMDRSSRVTQQFSGKTAETRLATEMTEIRRLFAEAGDLHGRA